MIFSEVLVLTILLKYYFTSSLEFQLDAKIKFDNMCLDLVKTPCFDDEKVLGTFWTIFYVWNEILDDDCADLSFEKATEPIKKRYRSIMERSLKVEIDWSRATLNQKLNFTDGIIQEALMLPVRAHKRYNVGLFQAIPKLRRSERLGPFLDPLPQFTVAYKLFSEDRYLIMMDCVSGIVSFLVRRNQKHTWKEIDAAIDSFDFDAPGFPACKYRLRRRPKN